MATLRYDDTISDQELYSDILKWKVDEYLFESSDGLKHVRCAPAESRKLITLIGLTNWFCLSENILKMHDEAMHSDITICNEFN